MGTKSVTLVAIVKTVKDHKFQWSEDFLSYLPLPCIAVAYTWICTVTLTKDEKYKKAVIKKLIQSWQRIISQSLQY